MNQPKRYTITAALPYANGPLHIGHLAGAYISADIYARYLRLKGEDVVFVCGSDEHGAAITIKAKKENTTPKEIVDKYHTIIRDSFEKFGISFDIYHRTSEKVHYDTSQEFFRILNEKNAFEIIESEQYYDEEAKQFLADRYIIGTCPKCGNENAYGDQCEKCGSSLNPTDLINPTSTISGHQPVLKKTKHWFLRLDEQQDEIAAWLETKKDVWKNHVYGQCKSWINDGLRPRAMTRDLDWGIPVPPEIEGSQGKVLYVWLDAPIGYISATKQLFREKATGQTEFSYNRRSFEGAREDDWKKYWQYEDTTLIHFIGKDNIVFHCIIFPAILKATGQYILPDNVPANEFMNLEGDKISTSRNWAVWLHEYLQDFPGREDELRYTLIANMPENKDSEFTWQDFQNRVNSELGNNLGNFVKRVSDLLHKFYGGVVPEYTLQRGNMIYDVLFEQIDQKIYHISSLIGGRYSTHEETGTITWGTGFRFREAMFEVMQLSTLGNIFLQENEPWKLIKTDEIRVAEIMYIASQFVGALAYVLKPLLPKTAKKIESIMHIQVEYNESGLNDFRNGKIIQIIPAGTKINPSEILFPKIEDEQIAFQIDKLNKTKQQIRQISPDVEMTQGTQSAFMPLKSQIQYDDFSRMDIRTGKILTAEKVEKADKLLKLTVDIGMEQRTIVSGIAEHFQPEEIIGKDVSVLINLVPRKLRGIESNGMILMAEDADGKLYFVKADGVSAGNVIK
ncbi:MAG: methionine--tRNA ligase [Sphingobacteriales bacterium]|nr:methionine--tRNA ligase [Sphingobacteriales bacterium]